MEFHLVGLGVRCMWLLLNVIAIHDVTRLGIVALADDLGMCDRSVPDNDSEISVNIGDILSLTCLTDIELPRNRLTWFKNDNALGDDNRIIIIQDRVPCTLETGEGNYENCDSLQLTIINITKEDEELYICRGAQRENGTIFVRVVDETPASTSTLAGTTLMMPSLTKPTCSSNISSGDVLLPSDNVMLTCMTDRYTFSAGSLDWLGHENIQTKDNDSYSTSLVMDVQTALSSHPRCQLSCDESVQSCQEEELSCRVPLFSVSPLEQEAEVGGNVSFTCEVSLKNYTVSWVVSDSIDFGGDQLYIKKFNDGRTSVFKISNLRPDQSGSLLCLVKWNNIPKGTPWAVGFKVASSPHISTSTADTGTTLLVDQTEGPTIIPQPPTTWCVYLSRLDNITSSSLLSLNLIIIIAVCGGVALIILVTIIIGIVCCRRRNKEPAIDISPVMAFGDLSHDNPVNMDVHFNVYSQHEIYDEGASSSDILHLDSTRRIPSVIHGRNNGHTDRKSSFIPITEDGVDIDERKKDDDDEPGRKLSYFVENDVYVTYDSNA